MNIVVHNYIMKDAIRKELIKTRLAEEIKNSGMTNTEIAKAIGVNVSLITQFKKLLKLPSITTLSKICEVIGADANYILGLVDN